MTIENDLITSDDSLNELTGVELNPDDSPIREEKPISDVESAAKEGGIPEIKDDEREQEQEVEEVANVPKMLATLLVENKVLDTADNINSYQDLVNIFDVKDEEIINRYKQTLPEEVRSMIDMSSEGVDLKQVKESVLTLTELNKLNDKSDAETYKKIIAENLRLEGYPEEYIAKRIEQAEDTDSVKMEGKIAKERLISKRTKEIEQVKEDTKRREQEQLSAYNKWLEDTKANVNNSLASRYAMNADLKEKVIKSVIEPVDVIEENGIKRPLSYLERSLREDPLLLAEINYFIMTKKIGTKAEPHKAEVSKAVENLENAYKNSRISGSNKTDSKYASPLSNLNLNI